MTCHFRNCAAVGLLFLASIARSADDQAPPGKDSELTRKIQQLDPNVVPAEQRERLTAMVRDDQRRRLQAANQRSTAAWTSIGDRTHWEQFRDKSLAALQKSLGRFPEPPKSLNVRVTGKIDGDGFRIEKVLFESRPGLWVSGLRYLPARPATNMPGILLCHSHHTPKEHGELQDMGMTWARHGCVVLVIDHLGHGERRQHPFRTAADYPVEFRPSRQDYYFRYDAALQLALVGESLMGWMVWDLMRSVDLLSATPGVDSTKIVLLGAVAGGGDPAAVTAALDRRITVAVPFNFGGPQPETRYPLPDDIDTSFNYAGSGSWESTRNLRRSAADGFLPWVIVGSIAPRRLIYAHEFNWDQERDPVWKRLQRVYQFYDASQSLSFTHGRGELRGQPPEATHCTHIGRFHRERIHQALQTWLGISVTPATEYSQRIDSAELTCWTPSVQDELHPRRLTELLPQLAADQLSGARERRRKQSDSERLSQLRSDLHAVLGHVEPQDAIIQHRELQTSTDSGEVFERLVLEVEPGISVPVLLLRPVARKPRLVICISQAGKRSFLKTRGEMLSKLLAQGIAVALPDLRGTGETATDDSRDAESSDSTHASTELMLGGTIVGARLRDLRSVIRYFRTRTDLDGARLAVWGDSFAAVNPPESRFDVPRRVSGRPALSEPLGGMLALLTCVFEDNVRPIRVSGLPTEFRSVLEFYQVLVPHDAIVPGLLTVADVPDLVAVASRLSEVRVGDCCDERNRVASAEQIATAFGELSKQIAPQGSESEASDVEWLIQSLKAD